MKFYAFIQDNLDEIVNEWEAFARTILPAATTMSDLALRDHARDILVAIVKDMQSSHTRIERSSRSREAMFAAPAPQTVAAAHGALRHAAGFDVAQVVSEFRAMRSSVLSLWRRSARTAGRVPTIEELERFNEAIDQALGESVQRYSSDIAASQDMFLAVLVHDLRSPLQGIQTASDVLAIPDLAESVRRQAAVRVRRAAKIMSGLITDLLDFTSSRLGRGIPIEPSDCDLRVTCDEALDAVKAIDPDREFVQDASGDLHIWADGARLRQVLSNLLNNAVQHGDERTPIALSACGEQDAVVVAIANSGKPIPPDSLSMIFEPLVQVPTTTSDLNRRPRSSLGLGLFIAREIVLAHRGTIMVRSSADTGTVFTIRLPRETPLKSANEPRGTGMTPLP
jgi:signal transduction histidine kinase